MAKGNKDNIVDLASEKARRFTTLGRVYFMTGEVITNLGDYRVAKILQDIQKMKDFGTPEQLYKADQEAARLLEKGLITRGQYSFVVDLSDGRLGLDDAKELLKTLQDRFLASQRV